jgi:hypothetical protein
MRGLVEMKIRKSSSLILSLVFVLTSLIGLNRAHATFDATGVTFDLSNSKLSFFSGSKTTAGTGSSAIYRNAATIQGLDIDVVVTVEAAPQTITEMDCGPNSSLTVGGGGNCLTTNGSPITDSYWDLLIPGAGDYKFIFSLYEAGSYTGANTGIPVVVNNLSVSTLDLDTIQSAQFFGFQRYRLATSTIVTASDNGSGRAKFIAANTALAGFTDCQGLVEVIFDNVSSFGFTTTSGGVGIAGFITVLGPNNLGCTMSSAISNPANRLPTSSNSTVDLRVANGLTHTLEVSNFGGYTDLDKNPLAQIKLATVPVNAKIQKRVDAAWVDQSANAVLLAADVSAGLYRVSSLTQSTSFTFNVHDGIGYSASAYTMNLNLVTSSQTITFSNPGTKTPSTTFASGASASSGLTVTLVSNTSGVCTVSGLSITTVASGTCSISATQTGDATYATAPSVTQQFTVSNKTAQVITFNSIAQQTYTGTTVVIASLATSSSNLTVTLSTSTPNVCTISSLNINVIATGNCSITARQVGDSTYAAASPVTQLFTITSLVSTGSFNAISLSGGVTTATYRVAITISVNVSTASKIIFLADGKRIAGCVNKSTTGVSPNIVLTCSWSPSRRGAVTLTAEGLPIGGGTKFLSAPLNVRVGNRTTLR